MSGLLDKATAAKDAKPAKSTKVESAPVDKKSRHHLLKV
jgi:hypothetical protein